MTRRDDLKMPAQNRLKISSSDRNPGVRKRGFILSSQGWSIAYDRRSSPGTLGDFAI